MAFNLHCTTCGCVEAQHLDTWDDRHCGIYESPSPNKEAELESQSDQYGLPDIDLGGSEFDTDKRP